MTTPGVQIDHEAVHRTGDELLALADAVRSATGAAEVDTVRADAPAGFAASAAANGLWGSWGRQLDQTATDTALFGHKVHAAATAWQDVDATNAALLGGG